MIRTLLLALFFSFAVILVLPWLVLWTILTGNPDFMYETAMKAVRFGNRLAGIRVRATGLENIPARPCVFISNHTSNLDPLVFIPAIPRRVGILVKRELFRIPIFSTAMMRAQFTPMDRGDRKSSGKSVSAAARILKEGVSYAIFAEGTRSPDGRLRPLRRVASRWQSRRARLSCRSPLPARRGCCQKEAGLSGRAKRWSHSAQPWMPPTTHWRIAPP